MTSPKKNQKKIGSEEREKLNEGRKLKKEKDEELRMELNKAELDLYEKSKKDLPTVLKERMFDIEKALEVELDGYKGLTSAKIHQLISRQTYYSTNTSVGYTTHELMIVFDAYKNLVDIINKKDLFIPSIKNFCAFAGISSNTYANYLQSPEEEKRNATKMIDDYISELLLDASKMRRTDNATSIFVARAEHNMTEAVNPMSIDHGNQVNEDQVRNLIKQIHDNHVLEAEFTEKEEK